MQIKVTRLHGRWLGRGLASVVGAALLSTAFWTAAEDTPRPSSGKDIFRFDTFGNETFWTDTLRLHETIAKAVDPTTALSVGLKVDADALPPGILKTADLKSPATTVALLKLNAVVGVKGTVVTKDGKDTLTRVGITCALCHSTVDDSVMPGIGHRLDGRPNLNLNPGAIIALSPALDAAKKAVYNSWGPGKYDPRYNQDGKNGAVVIPPAFGLAGVRQATFTGDGDISYWNNYVAVTQMAGHGSFKEPRLGISVEAKGEDLVKSKLPALREYQHSLAKPAPPAGSFDGDAAKRGQAVFAGAGRCASCHSGAAFTDEKLHAPAETGMDGSYAARSATKKYRATPLRALWQHPPYFHDGKAANLGAVVDHYDTTLKLKLTADQKKDLVEFLKSI
ncbi:MAG: c-type cytochrome [Solirubrobacterales bacterium]|jgi:mono/diheme cytochrome c family protein